MDVDQGYAGIVQVSEKGADKFAISFAASFLDSMNAAVVDLRSDNEPGCRACWWVGQVLYRVSAWHQKVKLQTYPSSCSSDLGSAASVGSACVAGYHTSSCCSKH